MWLSCTTSTIAMSNLSYHWLRDSSSFCSQIKISIGAFFTRINPMKRSMNFSFNWSKLVIELDSREWDQSATIPVRVPRNNRHWIFSEIPLPMRDNVCLHTLSTGSIFSSYCGIWEKMNFWGGVVEGMFLANELATLSSFSGSSWAFWFLVSSAFEIYSRTIFCAHLLERRKLVSIVACS